MKTNIGVKFTVSFGFNALKLTSRSTVSNSFSFMKIAKIAKMKMYNLTLESYQLCNNVHFLFHFFTYFMNKHKKNQKLINPFL